MYSPFNQFMQKEQCNCPSYPAYYQPDRGNGAVYPYIRQDQQGGISFIGNNEEVVQSDTYGLYTNFCHTNQRAADYNEALFSPGHNIRGRLIELINQERIEINIAMYTFTDTDIAHALIRAAQRGVGIYVILDGHQTLEVPEQEDIAFGLKTEDIWVGLWPPNAESTALQHNKFITFASTTTNFIPLVWTGSYNLTMKAATMNQENVLLTSTLNIVNAYSQRFDFLQRKAVPLEVEDSDSGDEFEYRVKHRAL